LWNQIVSTLYNLTRIDRTRQEQAAKAGLIPRLRELIADNSPLKQFAMEIILDLAKVPSGRTELCNSNGIMYLIDLLSELNWRGNIMDVYAWWLKDERSIENILLHPENFQRLVNVFASSSGPPFESMVEPWYKIAQLSSSIACALSQNVDFISHVVDSVKRVSYDAQPRLILMKLLGLCYDSHPDPVAMINTHNLVKFVEELQRDKVQVLIQEIARHLATAFDVALTEANK
jgi:hypothetical protein